MKVISLSKSQNIFIEFIETKLMPSAPTVMKWILGGSTFIITKQANIMIEKSLPIMKSLGLVNEQNQLDIELATGFIRTAFEKTGTIQMFGYNFDKEEGEALIAILEKHADE